ncbi:MAG: hypothetical protein RBS68_11190 [Anaerolineales bacterium]|jgi:hypothetical protein|nr:hypothetical protein [Anaerolineales bacterium]
MTNPEKTYAGISLVIASLAVGLIFLPGWLGMDGMRGGYAVSFVAIFIVLGAALVSWIFWQRAKILAKLLAGEKLLAHWNYLPEEWLPYAEAELKEQTAQNIALLILMVFWAILVGVLFWILDHDPGWMVLLTLLGLVLLLTAAAFWIPRWRYRRQRRGPGQAWIGLNAIYFDGVLTSWPFLGTRLHQVAWREPKVKTPAMLEFKLSYPSRAGMVRQTLRIPVPAGREAEAKEVLGKFESGSRASKTQSAKP